jgi:hypothetical protein
VSYNVSLWKDDDICEVPSHTEGTVICLGGTQSAEMGVTYNYGKFFDFRGLDGLTGTESIPFLEEAVGKLGTKKDDSYWASTPGNAGHACSVLLAWAQLHPDARWCVE